MLQYNQNHQYTTKIDYEKTNYPLSIHLSLFHTPIPYPKMCFYACQRIFVSKLDARRCS